MSTLRAVARRRAGLAAHILLAAVCYVPLLFASRGRLASDTRQAVYLDPGRYIVDALSMWDPSRDLGTVTHQNIVLVWPMGVYYRLADLIGVPLWFAQRVWLGTILFVAGAGVLHLARTLRWRGGPDRAVAVGSVVAAFAYAMSPYVLQYGTRTSVLLLPWAALPWLISFTARALETRSWRHPALIALVTVSIAVNATALALTLLGPALWVVWSVFGTREIAWRPALATVGRIGVVGVCTSVWWVVALLIEGRYGLPLLSFTETIDQVASTSSATEVLRGLGYWVPYLEQHGYREVLGSRQYLENLPVMALQFGVVLLTFAGIVSIRWRHRTFFGILVVVGVVVGIGAYPTIQASPVSTLFHDLARSGGIGLALRSTTRAVPLALLGMAFLLGASVDAVLARRRRLGTAVGAAVVVLAVGLSPSVGGRQLVDPMFSRPGDLPEHWEAALAAADQAAGDGRLLELPGIRYAAYRWGTTYEPVTAGYAGTASAWREQIPYGGAGSADVLVALDNRIQEGLLDPDALAPVARLLGVSQILVRNDLEYERYGTIAPDRVWRLVTGEPEGLGPPRGFGPVGTNTPDPDFRRDDQPMPADPGATYPPVGLVPVERPAGLVQVVPLGDTVVLDGDANGIVDAAAAGVLDGRAPVLEAAATIGRTSLLGEVVAEGAAIVLTDTNRRRVQRWRHIKNTEGVTLRADEDPAVDEGKDGGEASLGVFPGEGPAWQTVSVPTGANVSATRYGNPLWFEPGLRPAAAFDGDRDTGWQVGPTIGGIGDRLTAELDEPITTDHLAISGSRGTTHLTAVEVRFDGGRPERFELDARSRQPGGQTLHFDERTFSTISVELAATAPAGPGAEPGSFGIDEIELDGGSGPVRVREAVRLPTALVDRLGPRSARNPLSIVLTRLRGDVTDPRIFGEEPTIVRELSLPTRRSFTLDGEVRLPTDPTTGEHVGTPPSLAGGCRTDLVAVDGDPVGVRLESGDDESTFTLRGCEPLVLAAGRHRLETARDVGLDVDRLVLASAAGGAAVEGLAATSGTIGSSWTRPSKTELEVTVDPATGPAWLLLAESRNDGWRAQGPDGSLGDPVLLNGFANGWMVRDPGGEYQLRWTPQRVMDAALAASLVALLVAVVLAVRGRAWRPADGPRGDAPVLEAPWRSRPAMPWLRVVAATTALGLAAAVVIRPWWGVAVAAAVMLAGRWRRGHAALTAGSVAALAVALGLVVVERLDQRRENPFTFFTALHTPHRIALLAVALLAADLLLTHTRDGRRGE